MENPKTPYEQYDILKKKYPDAVILIRIGDFYETFREDAVTAGDVIGLTVTRYVNGDDSIPLAGFPGRDLDTSVTGLIHAGHRIVIFSMESPA
jgi:DNA mismatch repair protein mutS